MPEAAALVALWPSTYDSKVRRAAGTAMCT